MGLLSGLLLLPIAGPVRGVTAVLGQVKDRVNAEQLDESFVEDELVALSLRHDFGEVTDDDYLTQEDALLERLNAIRAYKESLTGAETILGGEDL